MNPTTFFSLIQDWKGTPMEAVMNILNTGAYRDSDHRVIKNKIIAPMTPLEKAIFTQLKIIKEEMKKQINIFATSNDDVNVDCFQCLGYKTKHCPASEKLHEIGDEWTKNSRPLRRMLATLIYERLGTTSSFVATGFLITSTDENFKSTYKKDRKKSSVETKTMQNLFEDSIQGTFLETVVGLMESEQFEDSEVPIEETDKLVGELNAFGKAMITMMVKTLAEATSKINELMSLSKILNPLIVSLNYEDFRDIILELFDPKDKKLIKKVKALSEDIDKLICSIKTFDVIFYGMLEDPVVEEISKHTGDSVVKKGFKLVLQKN